MLAFIMDSSMLFRSFYSFINLGNLPKKYQALPNGVVLLEAKLGKPSDPVLQCLQREIKIGSCHSGL